MAKKSSTLPQPDTRKRKTSLPPITSNNDVPLGRRNPSFVRTAEQRAADLQEIAPLTEEQLASMIPMSEWKKQRKEQITLRLDPEVLAYFRATGDGYQSRISEALRRFVAAQKSVKG